MLCASSRHARAGIGRAHYSLALAWPPPRTSAPRATWASPRQTTTTPCPRSPRPSAAGWCRPRPPFTSRAHVRGTAAHGEGQRRARALVRREARGARGPGKDSTRVRCALPPSRGRRHEARMHARRDQLSFSDFLVSGARRRRARRGRRGVEVGAGAFVAREGQQRAPRHETHLRTLQSSRTLQLAAETRFARAATRPLAAWVRRLRLSPPR